MCAIEQWRERERRRWGSRSRKASSSSAKRAT